MQQRQMPVPDGRYSVKLPAGKLYVKKGSMEDQLAAFFNDPNSKPSRRFLFNFDQVKFNAGTAVMTKESMTQVENVAVILKSFPNARIKIAGFNEKGGDSVLNSDAVGESCRSCCEGSKSSRRHYQVRSPERKDLDRILHNMLRTLPDSLQSERQTYCHQCRGKIKEVNYTADWMPWRSDPYPYNF